MSFFGGVYAAALFCFLSARRMGRAAVDGSICLAAAAVWTVVLVWVVRTLNGGAPPAWLEDLGKPGQIARFAGRAFGLALFGLFYLRRRIQFKAQDLSGVEPPNPWPVGLAAVAAAMVLTVLVVLLGSVVPG